MRSPSPPALGSVLVGLGLLTTGCLAPIELHDGSQVQLAVTDPEIVDELESLIAVMYFDPNGANACADLVDDDLDGLVERGPRANQAVPARPGEDGGGEHAFGNVGAGGPHSFLLLGSVRPVAELGREPLANARGSVIAVGCEELEVLQNRRYDLPVTLFPAGLR